jgi:AcrR family transcriptional regulator
VFDQLNKKDTHTMNLLEMVQKDKLALIAMHTLVKEFSTGLGLDFAGTVSDMCAHAGVNRTHVYEKRRHIQGALEKVELSGPGRPRTPPRAEAHDAQACAVRENVLRFRLAHPGAVVDHGTGQMRYSDAFRRYILDLADSWEGSLEDFCLQVEVPYPTFRSWQQRDRREQYQARQRPPGPPAPESASEVTRTILEDHRCWEGSLRNFFRFASARMQLPANQIRRVLVICNILPLKTYKGPRYRGSTHRTQPGSILVTDGKTVEVVSTKTGVINEYNWQAMVDQATTCHTASVITDTECAEGVKAAFEDSCRFMGKVPLATLHDNKPIYQETGLKAFVETSTTMIEATLGRAENKAVVEGEFGKFAQQVGEIYLDESNPENMRKSAVSEVVRAYTSGVNHAGRFEFDGKSRAQVLRNACPPTEKDRAFIERLRAGHNDRRPPESLPTTSVARMLLDTGFAHFEIEQLDPQGKVRHWLSRRFTPQAIRQALAIFGAEREKGRIRNKTAHRYLVKVIRNCQHELDLRSQEELLRVFAQEERQAWLEIFEQEYEQRQAEYAESSEPRELAFRMSESALFGSLILERSFWENKLKSLLLSHRHLIESVCNHVRRFWEAHWLDRFQLIDKIIAWQYQTAQVGHA